MKNEAKYVCCLGGFLGFLSFFTISLLLGNDVLDAVLRGSVGCLFCSLCFRGLLHLVLKGFYMANLGVLEEAATTMGSSGPEKASSAVRQSKVERVDSPESMDTIPAAQPTIIEAASA